MKFLHCADVHLGGANGQERMMVFERMLDFCSQNGVQLVLIAGDLFDAPQVEGQVRRRAFAAMERHPDISVLIAAGNHDPNCAGGNYDGALPGNVYVFGAQWSCVSIAELNVRVWGASFAEQSAPRFIAPERRVRQEDGVLELGVLHGELVSTNGHSDYRAVTQEEAARTQVHYLALGHVHERSGVMRMGRTHGAYCGCLQGAGFDEMGEKGAYLGNWDENGLRISFVKLCGSMWQEAEVDVAGLGDTMHIAQEVSRLVTQMQSHVRVRLVGEAAQAVDVPAVLRLVQEKERDIRLEDETVVADYALLARENTLRGAFVRRMLDRISEKEENGEDAQTEKLALRYGLAAFEGEVRTHVDRADTH